MSIYDRIINILIESILTEGSRGLRRRERVERAMRRKLQGNQSQINPDDPNLQEPGANTELGKQFYTPSERHSANARVANFFKRSAAAEAGRGERIRRRIVQGGQGLRRMAAGIHRGNPVTPAQKAANREVGGVAKTSPVDVLQQSRERLARLQQAGGNAASQARGIRHAARNRARMARDLPTKERYSSRAPVGEKLPESTMNIYDRIINILLEARVEDYLDRLNEANLLDKGKNWLDKMKARDARAVAQGSSRSARIITHKANRGVRLQGRKGPGNPTGSQGKEDY